MFEITNTHPNRKVKKRAIVNLVELILHHENSKFIESLSLVFLTNGAMRKLNKEFLNHDSNTDTLAFDLGNKKVLSGEMYVSLDQAAIQAKENGVSFENEVWRLVAHTTLHMVGYNDRTASQKKKILALGEKYLRQNKS